MRAEEYSERTIEVNGWPCKLTSYRIGEEYHCVADNVSPGARLARTKGATREEAESAALTRATELLGRTRRQPV